MILLVVCESALSVLCECAQNLLKVAPDYVVVLWGKYWDTGVGLSIPVIQEYQMVRVGEKI